jgi:NAD-dependent dihydropyrimidine dehydrogenase PreA subunit
MTYVIVGSCVKDDVCIEVCPVDCIHPRPEDPDFETAEQLYIDPQECIDCDACVEACPVNAIYPDFDVPEKDRESIDLNALFFAERSPADVA